jgi:hypothetical protein
MKSTKPAKTKAAAKASSASQIKRAAPKKGPLPPATVTTTYGAVSIVTRQPSSTELKKNLKESTVVIKRFGERIAKPGVKLPNLVGVPKFSVDSKDASLIVRDLNGKKQRGMFVKGKFKPVTA